MVCCASSPWSRPGGLSAPCQKLSYPHFTKHLGLYAGFSRMDNSKTKSSRKRQSPCRRCAHPSHPLCSRPRRRQGGHTFKRGKRRHVVDPESLQTRQARIDNITASRQIKNKQPSCRKRHPFSGAARWPHPLFACCKQRAVCARQLETDLHISSYFLRTPIRHRNALQPRKRGKRKSHARLHHAR